MFGFMIVRRSEVDRLNLYAERASARADAWLEKLRAANGRIELLESCIVDARAAAGNDHERASVKRMLSVLSGLT